MPLQNRVDPFGKLFAHPARGLFMGNRGGRFHNVDRTLGTRRSVSKQWICCRLVFNNRQRQVWGDGYTELFFLDEVTALAAGHRPCFECRRQAAGAFAEKWREAFDLRARPRASEIDARLHAERLRGRVKRLHRHEIGTLPDGAFVALEEGVFAVRGEWFLQWSPAGYANRRRRSSHGMVDVLTPPSIVAVFAAGYRPLWHPSADA